MPSTFANRTLHRTARSPNLAGFKGATLDRKRKEGGKERRREGWEWGSCFWICPCEEFSMVIAS